MSKDIEHLIVRAAEIIEEEAQVLKDSESVNGVWDENPDTRDRYNEMLDSAKAIRVFHGLPPAESKAD